MSDIDPREYGRLEARVDHLEGMVKAMSEDIRAMRDILEQSKGGWKVMLVIGSAAATAGGAVSWLVSHLGGKT